MSYARLSAMGKSRSMSGGPSGGGNPYPSFVRSLEVVVDMTPSLVAAANSLSPSPPAGQRADPGTLAAVPRLVGMPKSERGWP
jgi:hypothetical protein